MLNAVRKRVEDEIPVELEGNIYASPIGPTFEEFVKFVINTKLDDEHWSPYYKHCAICHVKYDFILK